MSQQSLPLPITLADMIAEVALEIRFREQVFPRRAMGASLALRNQLDRRMDVMRAVLRHLEAERDK